VLGSRVIDVRADRLIGWNVSNAGGSDATLCAMARREIKRGISTASPLNVEYRVDRIAQYLSGRWLDYGCADGGYTGELLRRGADEAVGVDVEQSRIDLAHKRHLSGATFLCIDGDRLPFDDCSFDGAFVNEVLEHVPNEQISLQELFRVLRPGGALVVISPNRWFPIEGHEVIIGSHSSGGPAPLIPWLPELITRRWTQARNYWPRQLIGHVQRGDFAILEVGFIWPVFEHYPWLPEPVIKMYQERMRRIDNVPGIRRFGVSTLVVGIRPQR
jgi:SAM-dependent methyltransferase